MMKYLTAPRQTQVMIQIRALVETTRTLKMQLGNMVKERDTSENGLEHGE